MRFFPLALLGILPFAGCVEKNSDTSTATVQTALPADSLPSQTAALPAGASVAPTAIAQDFTGMYVDDFSRNGEEAPFEGILQICPSGIAGYVLNSNQLNYTFHVKQVDLGDKHTRLDFYYETGDHGRGFMNADLAEPPVGTLVATAELTAEFELTFKWKATAFMEAVRKASPKDPNLHPFPKAFYVATHMAEPLRECDYE